MTRVLAGILMLCVLCCAACAGNSPLKQALPDPTQDDLQQPGPGQLAAGLPGLADLQFAEERSASIAGPGWQNLDLQYRQFVGLESGVTENSGSLEMDGLGSGAYCVWGLHGFTGDTQPTGLRVDLSTISGEYYLAYSDFVAGRWQVAGPFTESMTYEYPAVTELSNPANLVSGRRNHFVAIIVPAGNSMTLFNFAVGVDGGSSGPDLIYSMDSKSNAARLVLNWIHSTSVNDPDFAGYSVERSPFPAGQFTRLTEENIFRDYFTDSSAELSITYLYRVTAWDTSGNSAPSWNFPATRRIGGTAPPVCGVSLPRGPLTGPVEVTIDLSDSFDADEDPITDYQFDLGLGLGIINQPDPQLTVTLQPGCYVMQFRVTANGQHGNSARMLKVYPRWEDQSHLIETGTSLGLRNYIPRPFYDPQTEQLVFVYADVSIPAIVSLAVDASGNITRDYLLHAQRDGAMICSEPKLLDGVWSFTVSAEDQLLLASWQNGKLVGNYQNGNITDSIFSCFVTDGGTRSYVIYEEQNIGYDIQLRDLNTGAIITLAPGLADARFLDAQWNPLAAALDLVYSGGGSTHWLRWSPVGGLLANVVLNPLDSPFVDIELDPATDRPAVLFSDGSAIYYTALNVDNITWTAPVRVDPVDNDYAQTKLMYRDDTAWCYFGDPAGTSTLYRKDAALWTPVNDADFPGGGVFSSAGYIPGVPGFLVLSIGVDGITRLTRMRDDGSEDALLEEDGWSRMGLELSAASSGSEIHVLQRPGSNYLHYVSADGISWTETTDAGNGTGGKIVADQNGDIYASLVNGGNAYLRQWNDPAWTDKQVNPISAGSLPLIYGQGNALVFANFNGAAIPDEFYLKRDLNPSSTLLPPTTSIWDGSIAGFASSNVRILVRYGGLNFIGGELGWLNPGSAAIDPLFDEAFAFYDDPYCSGRHLEGCYYRNFLSGRSPVFYLAYGPGVGPARISQSEFSNDFQVQTFPAPYPEFDLSAYRRTVSATTAWGDTAVGLIANLLGNYTVFEWDNFGDWEELPLPAALEHASHHELVVGPDGRWHIIYRDWLNDDLRVISTVN